MTPATWRVGVLTVPGSTGTMAVTGLGGKPRAVIFWGVNFLTEDAPVTSTGAAIFRGIAAPKYDAPSTILQRVDVLRPPGAGFSAYVSAILQLQAGSFANLYHADVSSFDADGFTVTWNTVTAGGYKLVYAALMDVDHVGAFYGLVNQTGIPLGFKAGASLLQGHGNVNVASAASDQTQDFYGSAAYPGSTGWSAAGLTAFTFPTAAGQAYNIGVFNDAPNVRVAEGGHFTGPFLITSVLTAVPTGSGLTNLMFTGDAENTGMIVAWDDEDNRTGRTTPATSSGGVATVSGLPFAPGIVIGYSISDEPPGQSAAGVTRGAVGFSVAAPGFQWSALVDGFDRGAYQSFARGFCDTVHGSNVHAGTVALTPDGFTLTTDVASAAPSSWVWHAFGHPKPQALWTPQIYRRVTA